MERKMILGVVGASLLALAIGILGPAQFSEPKKDIDNHLPWKVKQSQGTSEVFGLHLGLSTMQQGLERFLASAEVSLFVSEDDDYMVEAFFDNVNIAGLGAKIVLTADLTTTQMQGMLKRGLRISTLGSGTRKVTLHPEDLLIVRASPIANITYLPRIQLKPEFIQKRFGEPSQKIKEQKSDATHWLYPELGVDVTLSESEKDLIQYVPPSRFSALLKPLQDEALNQKQE